MAVQGADLSHLVTIYGVPRSTRQHELAHGHTVVYDA